MISRLAYGYVCALFVIDLILVFVSLALHVSSLMGSTQLYAEYGEFVFFLSLGIVLSASFLAEERNVWKNEFTRCPTWLKICVLTLIIYGGVGLFFQVMFFQGENTLKSNIISGSAVPLGFEAGSLCILYSLLWSSLVSKMEFIKRVRNSVAALAACLVFVLFKHFSQSPPPTK
jgi:hypothetical protein